MNLITDKWIKVITKKEDIEEVSIFEFFQNSKDYVDISGIWPLRVTIYNLLFTIAQSSLKGVIVNRDSQIELFFNNYVQHVLEYLKKEEIQKSFDFYSKDFFYNFDIKINKDIEKDYRHNWKKLSIEKYSYGNNHTAWEAEDIKNIKITDIQKICNLLVYMLFDPGKGNNYPKRYRRDKLGFSSYGKNEIITYLKGNNCYETIWLNLMDENFMSKNNSGNQEGFPIGSPLWEKKPSSNSDNENLLNSQTSLLGVRMPLRSFFSYSNDRDEIYYDLVKQVGDNQKLNSLYPYKTAIYSKKESIWYLGTVENKYFMRDLPLILSTNNNVCSTPIINNINDRADFIYYEEGKEYFSDIKIVCGGWGGVINTSYFTRDGFSEFETVLSFEKNKKEDRLISFAEKYKSCLKKIDNFSMKNIKNKCSSNKYPNIFHFGKKSQKLADNILIEKLIQNLWYKIDNEYTYLIEICQLGECDFAEKKKNWYIKILKTWNESIQQYMGQNINNRIKAMILKQIGENIIFSVSKIKK